MSQSEQLEQLAKLVFGLARDVDYLLENHHEIGPGLMGGETQHPNGRERAAELRTTVAETRKFFGAIHPIDEEGSL